MQQRCRHRPSALGGNGQRIRRPCRAQREQHADSGNRACLCSLRDRVDLATAHANADAQSEAHSEAHSLPQSSEGRHVDKCEQEPTWKSGQACCNGDTVATERPAEEKSWEVPTTVEERQTPKLMEGMEEGAMCSVPTTHESQRRSFDGRLEGRGAALSCKMHGVEERSSQGRRQQQGHRDAIMSSGEGS